MFIGSPAERGHVYTPPSGRGETAVAAPHPPAGDGGAAAEAAPLINPAINFDYQSGIAVIVIRDSKSGEVEVQYPSKKVVEEYIRHGAASKPAAASAPTPDGQAAGPQDTALPQGQPGGVDPAAASPAAAPVAVAAAAVAPAAASPAHTDQTA